MDTADLDQKLTNAARQALSELTDDYRNQILLAAAEGASRATGELREISVHDILGALRRVSTSPRSWGPSPTERVLNLYMLFGLLLGVSGLGFFAVRDFLATIKPERSLPLLFSAAGFSDGRLQLLSIAYEAAAGGRLAYAREDLAPAAPELIGLFISRWQQIELALRSVASSKLGESLANQPLSSLLARLHEEGHLRMRTLRDYVNCWRRGTS